jgi:dihydroneopterin aldolase
VRDRLFVDDLRIRTIVGVHEWEQRESQEVLVHLEAEVDLGAAVVTDDLADTVDYGRLIRQVHRHVEGSRFHLVERLAGSIADHVLEQFPQVAAVTVRVDKPGASKLARDVAVQLRRTRG